MIKNTIAYYLYFYFVRSGIETKIEYDEQVGSIFKHMWERIIGLDIPENIFTAYTSVKYKWRLVFINVKFMFTFRCDRLLSNQ